MKYGRDIEYKMNRTMAKEVIKSYGNEGQKNPAKCLCRYVNEELGLKGNCVNVIIDME